MVGIGSPFLLSAYGRAICEGKETVKCGWFVGAGEVDVGVFDEVDVSWRAVFEVSDEEQGEEEEDEQAFPAVEEGSDESARGEAEEHCRVGILLFEAHFVGAVFMPNWVAYVTNDGWRQRR